MVQAGDSHPSNFRTSIDGGVTPIKPDTRMLPLRTSDTPSATASSGPCADGFHCNPRSLWPVRNPRRSHMGSNGPADLHRPVAPRCPVEGRFWAEIAQERAEPAADPERARTPTGISTSNHTSRSWQCLHKSSPAKAPGGRNLDPTVALRYEIKCRRSSCRPTHSH